MSKPTRAKIARRYLRCTRTSLRGTGPHSLPSRRCSERRCTGLPRRRCRRTADVRATGAVRREEVFLGERCAGAVVPSLPHVAALMRASEVRCARRYACCTRTLREARGKACVDSVRCVRDRACEQAADAHSAVLEQPRRMRLGRERGRTVLVTSRRCRLGRTGKGPAADDDHPAGHGADASARAHAARIAQHTLTRNRAERPFAVVAAGPLQHERPGVTPATTRRPALSQRASIALDKCESRLHACVDVLQQHREQISRAEHRNAHA